MHLRKAARSQWRPLGVVLQIQSSVVCGISRSGDVMNGTFEGVEMNLFCLGWGRVE